MKKRLLITSIVMMLVVAVALSTATYAWFTSNATATATQVTLKATTSSAPALGISWTDGNYGTSITPVITDYATDNTFTFAPVAPITLYKTGAVPEGKTVTDSTVGFFTSTTRSVAGDFKFNAAGAVAAKQSTYVLTDNSGHTSFFLKNLSGTNALTGTLTMTASIDGDGAGLIRVGVFKYNSTSEKYELLEVLANQDTVTYTGIEAGAMVAGTYYKLVNGQYVAAREAIADEDTESTTGEAAQVAAGTADWYVGMTATASQFYTAANSNTNAKAVWGEIVKDASVNAMTTYSCATSLDLGTNLAASTVIELKVVIWMDAAALGDAQQNDVGNITLNFAVA